MSERVVLVGYGPVGARLIEGLLPAVRDGRIDLTVVGAETHDVYNRVLLAEYAVGRADRDGLDMGDRLVAEEAGVTFVLGMTVVGVDRDRRVVRLNDGIRLPYDRLVLATGARANVPTLAGLEKAQRHRATRPGVPDELDRGSAPLPRGVVALRDLTDAEHVRAAVSAGQRIVVLGAGVLGMELALAAAEAGAEVVVAYHSAAPMNRTLDENGGRVLAAAATAVGVEMMHHARAESIVQRYDDHGQAWFDGLVCADGKVLAGDLLVLSCGVAARTEVASLAGLATSAGVLVDGASRSWTDPNVFAIGDCAHVADPAQADADGRVPGGPSGLIGPGWRQADRLAALLSAGASGSGSGGSGAASAGAVLAVSGSGGVSAGAALAASSSGGAPAGAALAASSSGGAPAGAAFAASGSGGASAGAVASAAPVPAERPGVVMLKAEGIDVVAGGAVDADPFSHAPECHGPQVTLWADPARGAYVKLVTVDGVLTGFVSVGMPRTGAELTLLFERGSELPADRSSLLRLDAPDAGMSVVADPFAADATVCWCNGVSAGAIREAVAAGEPTVACVKASTRAGTGAEAASAASPSCWRGRPCPRNGGEPARPCPRGGGRARGTVTAWRGPCPRGRARVAGPAPATRAELRKNPLRHGPTPTRRLDHPGFSGVTLAFTAARRGTSPPCATRTNRGRSTVRECLRSRTSWPSSPRRLSSSSSRVRACCSSSDAPSLSAAVRAYSASSATRSAPFLPSSRSPSESARSSPRRSSRSPCSRSSARSTSYGSASRRSAIATRMSPGQSRHRRRRGPSCARASWWD